MKMEDHSLIIMSSPEESGNIVFAEFRDNLKVDLAAAKEIVSSRINFTKNEKHYVIIDLSNVKQVTLEAKEYLQSPDGGLKNILGAAFIAANPVSVLIANIFIKTPKDFHAKFFATKEDALKWIIECRQKATGHGPNR
jgi:hypothetical protein